MTLNILRTNAMEGTVTDFRKKNPQFYKNYEFHSFFYEHRNQKLPGHIYLESELENFVNNVGTDPATTSETDLLKIEVPFLERTYPDFFADKYESVKTSPFTFHVKHKPNQHPIITENYDRFRVYKRRQRKA